MKERIGGLMKSDIGILMLLALLSVAVHTATNGQYGFHRDELQTLDDARHLDWGFVAYPPVTPLIGRIELMLFGTSLIGFRFFAAVAVSAAMVIAGLIAKELEASGENRFWRRWRRALHRWRWRREQCFSMCRSIICGGCWRRTFW